MLKSDNSYAEKTQASYIILITSRLSSFSNNHEFIQIEFNYTVYLRLHAKTLRAQITRDKDTVAEQQLLSRMRNL